MPNSIANFPSTQTTAFEEQFFSSLTPVAQRSGQRVTLSYSSQLTLTAEESLGALWIEMSAAPRPSFNPDLLRSLINATRDLEERPALFVNESRKPLSIEHIVTTSTTPGVFSLGGDLSLFAALIDAGDLERMKVYGRACVTPMTRIARGFSRRSMSIALVQGQALGGGFETALSHDFIIAERQSCFGFPERMFGLFPGMGATSFVMRRAGERVARELIESGKSHSAEQMLAMGLIDLVVDEGKGEAAVREFIQKRRAKSSAYAIMARARRRVRGDLTNELFEIADMWAQAAMSLADKDLAIMRRLVARQNELVERVS